MTRVFAHRGAAQEARENTVAAFLDARRRGADGVELDVRHSADGALVVHHDASIEGIGTISDLSVGELPEWVPSLDQVLEACEGIEVNVEIKWERHGDDEESLNAFVSQVLGEVAALSWRDQVIISSFDLGALDAVRRQDPEARTGYLLELSTDPMATLDVIESHGFDAIHPFVLSVDAALISAASARGVAVNTWTVNAAHDLERMVALGVDAIITDDVVLARRIVDGTE